MVTTVFYSLMPQKYINSKKKVGSVIKPYPLYLVNVSKKIAATNMKKTRLRGYVYDFSVDYNIINSSNIVNSRKYLIKQHQIK